MPTYDYRCPTCGDRFERFLRLTESDTLVPCPRCGAPAAKQLSTFAVLGGGSAGNGADCAPTGG